MSGQESLKGYLFQSLIAVLKSFEKEWNYISVEPNTELDKIDIIWSNEDKTEVCQVKSSINNFSKNDILTWIENLRLDNNNADLYSVCLIGNSTSTIKSFFNSISRKTQIDFTDNYRDLYHIKDKIKVVFEPNNIDTLEKALISEVDHFLFKNEISADFPIKKLITEGMVNQIIKISTSGNTMSRTKFEEHILEWINYNYSSQIRRKSSSFKLDFYLSNTINFVDTISKLHIIELSKLDIYHKKINKLKLLYFKLTQFNFEIKNFEKPYKLGDLSIFPSSIDTLEGYTDKQVIISDWEINYITKICKKLLSIEPDKEFFNPGDLKETQSRNYGFMFPSKKTWKGSEEELEKRKLYRDFYWEITETEDLMNFWNKISKLSLIPIVLSNNGNQFEEEINVQLLFPKTIKIYKAKNFPIPKNNQILTDVNQDNSFLFNSIKHKKNRFVQDYISPYLMPQFFEIPSLVGHSNSNEDSKYRRLLQHYFDYEYYDDEKYYVVECSFKNLNINEKISLPSYIFISSNHDFEIEYKISCKNNSNESKGKLTYKVSC